jgi:hypothetical protein
MDSQKRIENLEERLTMSSIQLSKYQRSSLWQRYLDSSGGGNNLGAVNQPIIADSMKEKPKKKKKKRLRI